MLILNKFPWLQAAIQNFSEMAPPLLSLEELKKEAFPEVYLVNGELKFSRLFRPEQVFLADSDLSSSVGNQGVRGRNKYVVLSFNTEDCFKHVSRIPFTQRKRTFGMLRLGLQKVLPMAVDSYIFGWHELGHIGSTRQIEQYVLKLATLREALDRLTILGFELAAVTFRRNGEPAFPIAILKDGSDYQQANHRFWLKLVTIGLVALIVSGFAVGWAKASWQRNNLAVLDDLNTSLLSEIQTLKTSQSKSENAAKTLSAARLMRNTSSTASSIIEELARTVPSHAFLTKLTVDGEFLTIEGLSTKPESLLARLEQSQLFSKATFVAPVFKNPSDSQSRFAIQMQLDKIGAELK
jgi:Tfp pilus assembly protein PilN